MLYEKKNRVNGEVDLHILFGDYITHKENGCKTFDSQPEQTEQFKTVNLQDLLTWARVYHRKM